MESMMTLTGNVGHSIELRQTKTGINTCTFRVGTTPRYRAADGWTDGPTTWVSVVCYRTLAEHVARSLDKGDPVVVHGRVRTQAWTGSQGEPHEKMVIEALTVGHDLNRGVTAFARPTTRVVEAPPNQAPNPGPPRDPMMADDTSAEPEDEYDEDQLMELDEAEEELAGAMA